MKPNEATITFAELKARLEAGASPVLIDCRFNLLDPGAGELAYTTAHVPGAVYAHLDRDLSSPVVPGKTGRHPLPDLERLAQRLGAWGVGDGVSVVVYDDGPGALAARLWWLLRYLGHDAVQVLDGGMSAWLEGGGSVSAAAEDPSPRVFHARLRPGMVASIEEIELQRSERGALLWDARAADRYRGENETLDPVPGHIRGAVSVPFAGNLKDGRFLPKESLRARFATLLGDAPPEAAITYCGSGVTACHNVLAAELAGFPGVRLYPGSYSEWITDPRRQVLSGNE